MLSKSSPLKLLGQMEPNLAGSIYVRSSITFLRFATFSQQIWLPRAIRVSDRLMLKTISPLKLLAQIKPNLAGSIYRFFLYSFCRCITRGAIQAQVSLKFREVGEQLVLPLKLTVQFFCFAFLYTHTRAKDPFYRNIDSFSPRSILCCSRCITRIVHKVPAIKVINL
jgi:hypothetical protein